MNEFSATDVTPGINEVIEITRRKKLAEPLPPYNIVGNGFTNRHGTSIDILEVCLQLNLAEMRLLQFLRSAFTMSCIIKEDNPNVIEPTKHEAFDKYLATALMKNYQHLEYLYVMHRIKRGVYMLNPNMFIPSRDYAKINAMWLALGEKRDVL